jgi:hypothetical protein
MYAGCALWSPRTRTALPSRPASASCSRVWPSTPTRKAAVWLFARRGIVCKQCYDEFQHVLTDCRVLVAPHSLASPGLSAQHFRCDGLVAAANWRRRRRLVQCTRTSQQRGSAAWPFATPMRCRRPPSWEAAHHIAAPARKVMARARCQSNWCKKKQLAFPRMSRPGSALLRRVMRQYLHLLHRMLRDPPNRLRQEGP